MARLSPWLTRFPFAVLYYKCQSEILRRFVLTIMRSGTLRIDANERRSYSSRDPQVFVLTDWVSRACRRNKQLASSLNPRFSDVRSDVLPFSEGGEESLSRQPRVSKIVRGRTCALCMQHCNLHAGVSSSTVEYQFAEDTTARGEAQPDLTRAKPTLRFV